MNLQYTCTCTSPNTCKTPGCGQNIGATLTKYQAGSLLYLVTLLADSNMAYALVPSVANNITSNQ